MIDAFLKIKGIKGECIDAVYKTKGVIQVLDCTVNGDSAPEGEDEEDEGEVIGQAAGRTAGWVDEETGFLKEGPLGPPQVDPEPPPEPEPKPKPERKWPFTFDITKFSDTATPALFTKFCQYKVLTKENENAGGSFIESAKLWVRKSANGKAFVYFTWEFRKLQVTNFYWSSNSDGTIKETVSFRFSSCQLSYTPQAVTGDKAAEPLFSPWDLETNTKEATPLPDSEVLG